jgi:biopolymer transport protein TolR
VTSQRLRDEARLRAMRTLLVSEAEAERPHAKSDINVTPLVDVVLVLLIIFMVVTPLIASGVAVDLPRTAHHARKADEGKDIIISVTQDKLIYVGATRVPKPDDVITAVAAERRKFPEKTLFLKGDARTPFGAIRELTEALRNAQITDITLGTEELPPER